MPIVRNASVKRTRSSVSFRMSSKLVIGQRCTKAAVNVTMLGGSGCSSSGRQANTAFALFRGDDLDLGIGGQTRIQGGERRLHLAAHVLHEHPRLTRLFERRVILVAPDVEIVRQVLVGVAEAVRALHPHLLAAHLLAQRRQHAPFVGDAVDRPTVFVVLHQILPIVAHHAVQRHLLAGRKHRGLAVPVLVQQGQGVHHGAVQLVVALEGQHLQQRGHDAAVVVAVGGARHQLHLVLVLFVGLGLMDQVVERCSPTAG